MSDARTSVTLSNATSAPREAGFGAGIHFGHQRFLALAELRTDGVDLEPGLSELREHLVLLFLDVVIDVFAEHLDLDVVQRVARLHREDLRDQVLRARVLDLRVRVPFG